MKEKNIEMEAIQKYEVVIGLEVHVQLLTQSKLFCNDSTRFKASPNTQVSTISLAHPGTLPVLNEAAVELAIRLGLAFGCTINQYNYFARKNYFYPDLPKGYQVTQHTSPICTNGDVMIRTEEGSRKVRLNRIHLEEDAGKSIHDADENYTCIDLNRAGVPLLEIVSEPDLFSAEEAFAYISAIRKMVRQLDVCDGNMEEGSLRCDANISLRKKGEKVLGTKVEIKNLNSLRNVKRAITFEIERQADLLEKGNVIIQQTRSFDAAAGNTFALREKEEANDYRYFPEPDLAPFIVTNEILQRVKSSLPELPDDLEKRLLNQYGLSDESIKVVSEEKAMSLYFENAAACSSNYKSIANWIIGPVKSYLNNNNMVIENFTITASRLAALADLVEAGKVNFGVAASGIFPLMMSDDREPEAIAKELNLFSEKNEDALHQWVHEILRSMPEKVAEYKKGKKNLVGLFAGEVKKKSGGKADMAAVTKIIQQKLAEK